jgi:type IV secretion system protein VirB6
MLMVFKVAGTMVSGWQVFGLGKRDREATAASAALQAAALVPAYAAPAAATEAAALSSRRAALTAAIGAPVEVMAAPGEGGGRSGERRTHVTQISGGGIAPLAPGSASRAKGIGSRFRASNDTARAGATRPAKEMIR